MTFLCCFEQILGAAPYRRAVLWPFTSHLTNHPSKRSKICWVIIWTHKWHSPMDSYTWTYQCCLTKLTFISSGKTLGAIKWRSIVFSLQLYINTTEHKGPVITIFITLQLLLQDKEHNFIFRTSRLDNSNFNKMG